MQRVVNKGEVEALIGMKIHDVSHFIPAFVHVSALKDFPDLHDSYERHEFKGDAALGFIVADYLYTRYPTKDPGFLTRLRTRIVSGASLGEWGRRLGLDRYILFDSKGQRLGFATNPRILEDCFEALCCSILDDSGLLACRDFVLRCIEQFCDFNTLLIDNNMKDQAMWHCQARGLPLPAYEAQEVRGPGGEKVFEVQVTMDGRVRGLGRASSKKEAEQLAAREALHSLDVDTSQCFIE